MSLSRFPRGTFSRIINCIYSTYYIILMPAILWYSIILHASQYERVFWSIIWCVGIPRLQGCMVCCSWNFMIMPIVSNSNSYFFKKTVWPNMDKTWNSTQYSIFCRAFSYPYLLVHALHHGPFVHNGFYYWLYIIINSTNSWRQQKSAFKLAWQNSINYILSHVC